MSRMAPHEICGLKVEAINQFRHKSKTSTGDTFGRIIGMSELIERVPVSCLDNYICTMIFPPNFISIKILNIYSTVEYNNEQSQFTTQIQTRRSYL